MSSSAKEKKIENISQLKLNLQEVIKNIKRLEEQKNGSTPLTQIELQHLMEQTDVLLNQVENEPVKRFCKLTQKRKKKRILRKNKQIKPKNKALSKQSTAKASDDAPAKLVTSKSVAHTAPLQKAHHQLRNYHDAQRFLRTFELLEMLHMARSQDVEETRHFAAEFNILRTIWNSILSENTLQRTQECKLEDQWNEVFFGANEMTYYGSQLKIKNFLQIRNTWDSYLTNNRKYGSSIPPGWVLPKEEAEPRWAQYRTQ